MSSLAEFVWSPGLVIFHGIHLGTAFSRFEHTKPLLTWFGRINGALALGFGLSLFLVIGVAFWFFHEWLLLAALPIITLAEIWALRRFTRWLGKKLSKFRPHRSRVTSIRM